MSAKIPFTDYDFYAYLTSGTVLLAVLDYVLTGGEYLQREEWSVVQIVVAIAFAYVTGQLTSILSTIILENWLANRVLSPPFAILTGTIRARSRELLVARLVAAPYYRPLSEHMQRKIRQRARVDLAATADDVTTGEEIFHPAHAAALKNEHTRQRLDDLRERYAMSRNLAIVGGISSVLFLIKASSIGEAQYWWLAAAAAVFGLGMIARFLKFYSSYAGEVARAYAFDA